MNITARLQLESIPRLECIAGIQGTIREAVIEGDENAARWLDEHLATCSRMYLLAALAIAQMLIDIQRRSS